MQPRPPADEGTSPGRAFPAAAAALAAAAAVASAASMPPFTLAGGVGVSTQSASCCQLFVSQLTPSICHGRSRLLF
jgi:hypothetical protein